MYDRTSYPGIGDVIDVTYHGSDVRGPRRETWTVTEVVNGVGWECKTADSEPRLLSVASLLTGVVTIDRVVKR